MADGKSLNAASGGDILRDKETELLLIKGFKSKPNHSPLTNPELDSVSRIDGGNLSSKIFEVPNQMNKAVLDIDIKDFTQKLKAKFCAYGCEGMEAVKCRECIEINKLAGASLTGLAKEDLI